jgi:hypothetical protein
MFLVLYARIQGETVEQIQILVGWWKMQWSSFDVQEWAERTYGLTCLADHRRTRRAVQIAAALAAHPAASIPTQMGSLAATKAAYRLLECPKVTYERLMRPHLQQSMDAMRRQKEVLLIQDLTEIDYRHHPATSGLAPVSRGNRGRGYLLQTVLAVCPSNKEILGIASQHPFLREPAPKGETKKEKASRAFRESMIWQQQVEAIGPAPKETRYIHVGDRASDIFSFLRACGQQKSEYTIRVQHNRRVDLLIDQGETPIPAATKCRGAKRDPEQPAPQYLFDVVRGWSAQDVGSIVLDGNHKRKQREAHLCLSWGSVRLWPPEGTNGKDERPMQVQVVRTWEVETPEGEEPLEWMLLVSLPVETATQAWEKVHWYRMRWIIEDYHQCLKTGCSIEERQMQSYDGLQTMLGFLAPLAVRLLQLRTMAQQQAEELATTVFPKEVVALLAFQNKIPMQTMSARACWRAIAQMGGFLGRKGDGEPGWKTIWRGWLHLQTLLEGMRLATQFSIE